MEIFGKLRAKLFLWNDFDKRFLSHHRHILVEYGGNAKCHRMSVNKYFFAFIMPED